jgi:pullulanase/glycogen debranching enzyme
MTKPKKKNSPIETYCDGMVEVYSDELPPNASGDNNSWKLNSEVSKMLWSIIETDLEKSRSLDYLKNRTEFAKRCTEVLKLDIDGAEPQRFRKNVFDGTIKHLKAYFNAIDQQDENARSTIGKKFHEEFKKIIHK